MSTAQTPTLVKIKTVGETLTLAVMSAALVPTGDYPEVEFVGFDGKKQFTAIRVPQKSADRQLQRCEINTLAEAVGKLLTFSRSPNTKQPTKPFWDVTLEGEAPAEYAELLKGTAAPTPAPQPSSNGNGSAPAAAPTNGTAEREKYSTAYKRITEFVLTDIVPLYEAKKIPVTAEACHAMAATLFIGVTRNGH
jgi:hypothetical protein